MTKMIIMIESEIGVNKLERDCLLVNGVCQGRSSVSSKEKLRFKNMPAVTNTKKVGQHQISSSKLLYQTYLTKKKMKPK